MSNQITTQTLSFHGSDLITLKVENVIYTAIRPIVEAIGLDWASQSVKLNKNKEKFGCCDIATPTNGGLQKMLCMPIKKLNGWLFSINPEKVRSDLKEKVICYQEECFEALYNYWHFGKAERKTTVNERTGLRNAVNMLVSKKGLLYNEAYNLVHHYMNVESIEDIPADKLQSAVEYVHKICLEGELIIDSPKQDDDLADNLTLTSMWFALYNCLDLLGQLEQPLRAIGSHFGSTAYTHATEYRHTLQFARDVLMQKLEGVEISSWEEPHYHLALKTMRAREYPLRRGINRR
ncbi:phage antirepressor N-terminal domain-containing protein [Histophilus somni]|uniref:phage antirepressor N-terminal domain-containing protein n=1 Tax=Histophilus somni TaxID=731 RepID=UPI0000397176|nr:phage antirepressor N-terminal domain-containing protein [Histophilus somni]ACA32581.1 putative antirepressor protein [Histophilus somni 2336]